MLIKIRDKETGLTTFHKVALTYPLLLGILLKVKKKAWAFSMGKGICLRIENELKAMGYTLEDQGWNMGDIQAIRIDGRTPETASDPRGRGVGLVVNK